MEDRAVREATLRLPEKVYYVVRHTDTPKPYYGRRDRRLFRSWATARTFIVTGDCDVYEAEVTWRKVED